MQDRQARDIEDEAEDALAASTAPAPGLGSDALRHAWSIADYLGSALGPRFEVVLQDLRPGNYCIAHVAGDVVTGRTEGSPLTELGMRIAQSGIWRERDYVAGYLGETSDGRTLFCSTYFVKEDDDLVGLLCINEDRSAYEGLAAAVAGLRGTAPTELDLEHPDELPEHSRFHLVGQDPSPTDADRHASGTTVEHFFVSNEDAIDDILRKVCPGHDQGQGSFSPAERERVVEALDRRGFFLMKGTIRIAAERLGCSVPSIYRYRQHCRGQVATD